MLEVSPWLSFVTICFYLGDCSAVILGQDLESFISKGVKLGIAQHFGEDIRRWVENVKRAIPVEIT